MTGHEKAIADVEMAECDIEDGRIEKAREHVHSAISRVDGKIIGEIGEKIKAVIARLE